MLQFLEMNLQTLVRFAGAAVMVVFSTSSFAMDRDLTHFRLPNGLAVFVKEDHSRKVAAIRMWVMVGSRYVQTAGTCRAGPWPPYYVGHGPTYQRWSPPGGVFT